MSTAIAPTPIMPGVVLVSEEDQPIIPTPWRTVGAVRRWFDSKRGEVVGFRTSHDDCPLARCYRELDGEHHRWVVGLTGGAITVDDGSRVYPMEEWEQAFTDEIDMWATDGEEGTEPVTGYGAYSALKRAIGYMEEIAADAKYEEELQAERALEAQV